MEVDVSKEPSEGEVFVFTTSGGFVVRGSQREVLERLRDDDWATFELAETGDPVIIRTQHVVALRAGTRAKRGSIGFMHATAESH
ncbi:MAG TPA: hypothetical protein VKX16_01610 [Chloroflexota bacterium]|nr:hypothetical protein [Chloroflexota bacterium]